MDESGLSKLQKPSKIFITKGKQVGAHTTVVCCMNLTGFRIARKKFKQELFDGVPSGTLELIQESGWMAGELFLKWLKHLVKYFHATIQNPVLLILDGHASDKYLEALEYAKQNCIYALNPDIFPDHLFALSQVADIPLPNNDEPTPGTSSEGTNKNEAVAHNASFQDISPVPVAVATVNKKKRRRQATQILTSSPFIEELKEKHE
ncbi:hypothetical protein ILUMI_12639 [Ignelater luminosus]|uniref:DDE-1 domain-containing protein n=1 Tax=Ignelater luminosus TaxID=2038154 RepID=A0A8K0CTR2_IGNLU|nr:hypothetical protein ILUMI_12639 [Ignelater luminosus]